MPNENESPRWRKSHTYALLSSAVLLLSALVVGSIQRFTFAVETGRILAGLSMLVGIFSLVLSQYEPVERGREFFRVALELGTALVISVGFTRTLVPTVDIAQSVLQGTTAGIVVFMVAIVIRTVRQSQEFEKLAKKIPGAANSLETTASVLQKTADATSKTADRLDRSSLQADYAALAAQALQLEKKDLFVEGNEVNGGLIAAVSAGLWTTRSWVRKSRGPELSRRLWHRVMTMYHQEETFGLARCHFPTSVRNFAFLLLGMLNELLEHKNDSQRVVVLNCTNFPPKDFFNFPGHYPGRRFYYEPQFFGTYRRALGSIVGAKDDVLPMRILLCGNADHFEGHKVLGLDSKNKLIAFGRALKIWPIPLEFTDGSLSDGLRTQLEATNVCDESLVELSLPSTTPESEKLLYRVPTWHDRDRVEQNLWGYLENAHDHGGKATYNWGDRATWPIAFVENHRMQIASAAQQWVASQEEVFWQKLAESCSRAKDLGGTVEAAKIASSWTLLEGARSKNDGASVGSVFRWVQELDMFIQLAGVGDDCAWSLPPAENWLYWKLVGLEQSSLEGAGIQLPAPSWELFCHQAMSLRPDSPELSSQLRLAPHNTLHDLHKQGIESEFLLLGLAENSVEQPKDVEWHGFIGAELTEPFKTCRFSLELNPGDEAFARHTAWVQKVWEDEKNETKVAVEQLAQGS